MWFISLWPWRKCRTSKVVSEGMEYCKAGQSITATIGSLQGGRGRGRAQDSVQSEDDQQRH